MASSKREKELARQRAERQAARRAAAERKKKQRNAIIAAVVAVLLVASIGTVAALSLGGDDDSLDTASPTPTASAEASVEPSAEPSVEPSESAPAEGEPSAAAGDCAYTETGDAAREVELPPASGELAQQAGTATISTDRGNLQIDLLEAEAPCTVNSFASLAQQQYYADTPCHRLTTSGIFVLQCGDPTGTGTGGPGYAYPDENLEGATYPRGTVAMANAGPGTNGSQFFLVYKDSQLPPSYTPFGTITEGLDILDTVAAAGATPPSAGGNTAPNLPVQIADVTVTPPA